MNNDQTLQQPMPTQIRGIRSLSEAETANAFRKTISVQRRARSLTMSGSDTIAIKRRINCVLYDNYFSLDPPSKMRDIATTTTNGCYNRYFHSLSADVARCAILIYYHINGSAIKQFQQTQLQMYAMYIVYGGGNKNSFLPKMYVDMERIRQIIMMRVELNKQKIQQMVRKYYKLYRHMHPKCLIHSETVKNIRKKEDVDVKTCANVSPSKSDRQTTEQLPTRFVATPKPEITRKRNQNESNRPVKVASNYSTNIGERSVGNAGVHAFASATGQILWKRPNVHTSSRYYEYPQQQTHDYDYYYYDDRRPMQSKTSRYERTRFHDYEPLHSPKHCSGSFLTQQDLTVAPVQAYLA